MISAPCLSALLLSTIASVAAGADTEPVRGSGSTFVAPLMTKWIESYCKEHGDLHVEYQANGSGAGIKDLLDHTVAFAASDAPLSDAQLKTTPDILHLPVVAGPEVIIYNPKDMPESLVLDGAAIAGIFLGSITHWDDPKIVKLNPGATLPSQEVITVHRSDGSGTTWIFSNYLTKVSSEWSTKPGCGTLLKWPSGIGGRGNQGVAEAVEMAVGGIGYVELAFAKEHRLPYAKLVNHDGKTVEASLEGVSEAVRNTAGGIPDDLRQSITDAPGPTSYPICGFSYFLVHRDLGYLKNEAMAAQAKQFIDWCEHAGQAQAAPNYIAISPEVQQRVEEKLKMIGSDGKLAPSK